MLDDRQALKSSNILFYLLLKDFQYAATFSQGSGAVRSG
jgi:hypothetical protein